MKREIEIRQLEVILNLAPDESPGGIGLKALRRQGVFPEEWPVVDSTGPQIFGALEFENGVSFVVTPESVRFSQNIEVNDPGQVVAPALAQKYLEQFPEAQYSSVSVMIKGHKRLADKNEGKAYVLGKLLRDGPWKNSGPQVLDASCRLSYRLENCLCELRVQRMSFTEQEGDGRPVLAFFAEFEHEIDDENFPHSSDFAVSAVKTWKDDWDAYVEIVDGLFLGEEEG